MPGPRSGSPAAAILFLPSRSVTGGTDSGRRPGARSRELRRPTSLGLSEAARRPLGGARERRGGGGEAPGRPCAAGQRRRTGERWRGVSPSLGSSPGTPPAAGAEGYLYERLSKPGCKTGSYPRVTGPFGEIDAERAERRCRGRARPRVGGQTPRAKPATQGQELELSQSKQKAPKGLVLEGP